MNIHPFGNRLALLDLTGSDIRAALEHGLSDEDVAGPRLLQTAAIRYRVVDKAREVPVGKRVARIEIRDEDGNWTTLDPEKTYRIVTNEYLAQGGDKFSMLAKARARMLAAGRTDPLLETGVTDIAVLTDYVKAQAERHAGCLPAPVGGRIAGLHGVTWK